MGIFSKKSKIKPEYKKSLVARLGMKSKEMDQKFQEGIKICNAASEDSNPGGKFQEGCEIFMDLTKHGHLPSIEQLVYIFLGQKEFDVAEGYIDRAKDPNDPIILYLKARLMEEREGIDAAVESFKAAAEAGNPNSISLMFSWAIQDCDIKEAEDCLEKLKRHKEFFAHPGKSETIEDLQKQLDDLKSNQQSRSSSTKLAAKSFSDRRFISSNIPIAVSRSMSADDLDSDDEEIAEDYDENSEIWTRYEYALDSPIDKLLSTLVSPTLTKIQSVEFLDEHEDCFGGDLDLCNICEELEDKTDVLRLLASNPALDQSVQMRVLGESLKWQGREIGVMLGFAGNPNISNEVKEYIFGYESELNNYGAHGSGIIDELAEIAESNPRISKKEIKNFLNIYFEED